MMARKNTSIVAAGKKFDVGCRVVLWSEEEGLSFYPKGGFTPRNLNYKELKEKITCFTYHHSATYTAHAMYRGLIGRGLSANFMIDDDVNEDGYATIYQCLDIKDYGWSQKPLNSAGPGVELSYHPTYWSHPNLYDEDMIKKWGVQRHEVVEDRIHGMKFKVFAPTEAQIKSAIALGAGFCRAFPDVPAKFPRDNDGKIAKGKKLTSQGLLAHFHITTNKIDPMGFPFERVEKEIEEINSTWHLKKKNLLEKVSGWLQQRKGGVYGE